MIPVDADAFNAFEAQGWQAKASAYDAFFGSVTSRVADRLLDAADVAAGTRVLDVAAGPGYVSGLAVGRGAAVTALDVAPAMVALLRERHPKVDAHAGDAEDLPFPDGSFDALVCNFGVLHLGRPERAAREFHRVLRTGGWAAFTVWDTPQRARLVGVFVEAMAEAGATPPADLPGGPPFFRFSDDAEAIGLLAGAGFTDVVGHTLTFTRRFASAGELWDGMLGSTVRTGPSVLGQPDGVRRRIRAAFERIVTELETGDGYLDVPVSVKLTSGRRP
jgi:SAM-dependent methyltransferase